MLMVLSLMNLFGREQTPCGRPVRQRKYFSKKIGRDTHNPLRKKGSEKLMVPQ